MEKNYLSLSNLRGGAAIELFDRELVKALANVRDPNAPWKGRRKIALVLTIEAVDEKREEIDATLDVRVSLPSVNPLRLRAFVGTTTFGVRAREDNAKQTTIEQMQNDVPEGVSRMPEKKAAGGGKDGE